jgi:hypothetical protein
MLIGGKTMIWNKGFHNALEVHSSMNPEQLSQYSDWAAG